MKEGPCTNCTDKNSCSVYPALSETLFRRPGFQTGEQATEIEEEMDSLGEAWMSSLVQTKAVEDPEAAGASFSALFDLLCSALYARETLGLDVGSREGRALRCGSDLVFPYTWMCPLCVAKKRKRTECYLPDARRELRGSTIHLYPIVDSLSKPRSRFIGDVGIKALRSIIRVILNRSHSGLSMAEGGGRRGEFDLTLSSESVLILCEVKAKPLVAYPVVSHDSINVANSAQGDHEWLDMSDCRIQTLNLFFAAANLSIPLGRPDCDHWPLPQLRSAVADPGLAWEIAAGWIQHLKAYSTWKGEPDELRWHRFGCGNFSEIIGDSRVEHRVANTKELPGLDRTDDIKKGTAQVLLFDKYKMGCSQNLLRTALLGNIYAETHGDDYLDTLAGMQVRSPSNDVWCWIFDMILAFTKNVFTDHFLADVFDPIRVLRNTARGEGG